MGKSQINGPFKAVLGDIGIELSGKILPCCSSASLIEKIALGNAKEKILADIIEEAKNKTFLKILSKQGPIE